jgi:hypothetical protein
MANRAPLAHSAIRESARDAECNLIGICDPSPDRRTRRRSPEAARAIRATEPSLSVDGRDAANRNHVADRNYRRDLDPRPAVRT